MSFNFIAANGHAISLGTTVNLPGTNDKLYLDAWIKVRTGTDGRVIDKATATSGQTFELAVDNNPRVKFVVAGSFLAGAITMTFGKWHYISASYDGATMAIYVDGILDTTKAKTGNVPNNTAPTRIGAAGFSASSRNFDGLIYRPRVFNRAFSSGNQVISIFEQSGADTLTDELFYEWKATERGPGATIGANVVVNTGPQTLANGSGEGTIGLPTWDDQDLQTNVAA